MIIMIAMRDTSAGEQPHTCMTPLGPAPQFQIDGGPIPLIVHFRREPCSTAETGAAGS